MNSVFPKGLVWVLGILLAVFVSLLVVEKGSAISDKMKNKKPANTISVTGEGRVESKPDMATVTIGVVSQGTTAQAVKDENNRKMNAVISYIKQQGVPESDIKTEQYFFNPNYDWKDGRSTIIGYQGNQNVTVKLYGVDKSQDQVEKVMDGVVAAGANQVYGVNFGFKDPDGLRQEARKQAIAKAKEKAQELAREAGLTLGKVVSISEAGYGGGPVVMPYAADQALERGAANMMKSIAPDIQPGSTEISQSMTVTFEVK